MFVASAVHGQNSFNYDEEQVPSYILPELLSTRAGVPVATRRQWERIRRPEVLELFTAHMFGRVPNDVDNEIRFEVLERGLVLENRARRLQVRIFFGL